MIRLNQTDAYVVAPGTTIRDVMARMNACRFQFQLVLDDDGRLLGTVTDGDVRRAMLRGVTLDQPVADCMHGDSVTGRAGEAAQNAAKLRRVGANTPFLPVVDGAGVVREVLIIEEGPVRETTALVMAGGRGTRLGKRTRATPKPLLSVGGKPILERILAGLEDAGVANIYISVCYLAEKIEAFIDARANRAGISLLAETEPLGTAGALGQLPPSHEGSILVVNGDLLTRVDVRALEDFHHRHGHDGTVAVARYDVEIPFGIVRHGEEGLFLGIEEKPHLSHLVAAGMYYLSPQFIPLVPRGRRMDMPELLNLGRDIGLKVGLFPVHEYWLDVGRPDDLATADNDHMARS